jgi:hypothetical protein
MITLHSIRLPTIAVALGMSLTLPLHAETKGPVTDLNGVVEIPAGGPLQIDSFLSLIDLARGPVFDGFVRVSFNDNATGKIAATFALKQGKTAATLYDGSTYGEKRESGPMSLEERAIP